MRLGARGDETVTVPRETALLPLRAALLTRLSLANPTRATLELLAAKATAPGERATLAQLLAPEAKETLSAFLHAREQVDLLAEFPSARPTPSRAEAPRSTAARGQITARIA